MAVNVHDMLLFLRTLQHPDLYAVARVGSQKRREGIAVNFRAEDISKVALPFPGFCWNWPLTASPMRSGIGSCL